VNQHIVPHVPGGFWLPPTPRRMEAKGITHQDMHRSLKLMDLIDSLLCPM